MTRQPPRLVLPQPGPADRDPINNASLAVMRRVLQHHKARGDRKAARQLEAQIRQLERGQ